MFTGGAKTSYQPVSPSRLSKEKTFNNLCGTKGRRQLSWGVGRACVGTMQEGLRAGSWAGGLGSPREVNVGSWGGGGDPETGDEGS